MFATEEFRLVYSRGTSTAVSRTQLTPDVTVVGGDDGLPAGGPSSATVAIIVVVDVAETVAVELTRDSETRENVRRYRTSELQILSRREVSDPAKRRCPTTPTGGAAVVAGRATVPFGVDRSAIRRYLGADRRTYHLVASHLAVDAETSFARRPRHADHGFAQRYQPAVYTAICNARDSITVTFLPTV